MQFLDDTHVHVTVDIAISTLVVALFRTSGFTMILIDNSDRNGNPICSDVTQIQIDSFFIS